MKIEVIDRTFVRVHGAAAPTDAEWERYLVALEHQGPGMVELVVLRRPGPTRRQLAARTTALRGRDLRTAVLCDAWSLRASMFLRPAAEVEVFSSHELAAALAHLDIPSTRLDVYRQELARLEAEESTPRPPVVRSMEGGGRG